MAIVEDLPTGKVTGQYLFVNQDNADAGTKPNAVLVTGYVRFTCSATAPLIYPAHKVSVIPLVHDAVFDSQGFLIPSDPAQSTPEVIPGHLERGIELLADAEGVNPRGFTWNVQFALREVATGRNIVIPSYNIHVSEGETVDLTEAMPVGASNGVLITQGPAGPPGPASLVMGTVDTEADLPPAAESKIGSAYIVDSDRSLWVLHLSGWQNAGSLSSTPEGGTTADYLRGDNRWAPFDKTALGLDNIDNTRDMDKPLSTAALNANQSFRTSLDGKANVTHTHTLAQISDATDIGRSLLGVGNAQAARTLLGTTSPDEQLKLGNSATTARAGNWVPNYSEITGTIPTAALPPLAIVETSVVASQAAMLALTAQRGDIAIRSDNGRTYILAAEGASTLSNWKEFMAAGQVASVAGKTGVVSLAKADVGLGSVDNTSDVNKPVSWATQVALNAKASLDSPIFTGTVLGITKSMVGLGNADNTRDLDKPVSTAVQSELSKLESRADRLRGAWRSAVDNRKTKAATWVSLGSSTANGGNTDNFGLSWAGRISTFLTGKPFMTSIPNLSTVTATNVPATGVNVYTGAVGGTTSANYITDAMVTQIGQARPTLITHMVGSNDFAGANPLATYKANLRNWYNKIEAVAPNAKHLYIHQQGRNDLTAPPISWADYGRALKEFTDSLPNTYFFNADEAFNIAGMTAHIMSEKIHMNANGHRMLADAVSAAMGTPIQYGTKELYRASGMSSMTTTEGTVWATINIPAAPYPRIVKWASSIYSYGTGAAGSTGPEVSYKCVYDDDGSFSGEMTVHRILQGGVGYAHPYVCTAGYTVDAHRSARLEFQANANIYLSGAAAYTEVQATAEPA